MASGQLTKECSVTLLCLTPTHLRQASVCTCHQGSAGSHRLCIPLTGGSEGSGFRQADPDLLCLRVTQMAKPSGHRDALLAGTHGGGDAWERPGRSDWTCCWDQLGVRTLPLNSKHTCHQAVSGKTHLSPQCWTPNPSAGPPGGAAQWEAPRLSCSRRTPVPGVDSSLGCGGEGHCLRNTPTLCPKRRWHCQPLRMSLPDAERPLRRTGPKPEQREKPGGEVRAGAVPSPPLVLGPFSLILEWLATPLIQRNQVGPGHQGDSEPRTVLEEEPQELRGDRSC